MEFSGKKAVVIGGTSGIGAAVAQGAATRGAAIVVGSSSPEKIEKARAAFASGTEVRHINVKDEASVAAFFEAVGAFDHLVYTAGDWGSRGGTSDQIDLDVARNIFAVRFWGALAAVKHAQKHMPPGGSITVTDGMIAHRPRKGAAVSTAMAGAIEHLVRSLAVELAPIRVNGVCPGYIETDIWGSTPREQRMKMTERYPLRRPGTPEECAEAYLYLMRGGYTTGQVLYVDGGMGLV
jgi:NAD(P)-dependent dehydrogenase (short-subunit alcohol dehydrogenase family)